MTIDLETLAVWGTAARIPSSDAAAPGRHRPTATERTATARTGTLRTGTARLRRRHDHPGPADRAAAGPERSA
ncbi:hypothetical protein ACFC1R_19135 [Kitasatospora sp. NPDC056138]|uniref:hypothetical protein n=1 Tax=Kitasatospora sp. NPDC056138 TaxID=3345724 RepID=UPI0035DE363C